MFLSCSISSILNIGVMKSITLGRVYFGIYLLNCTSFGHETWSTNSYSHEQYFQKKFFIIWRTRFEIQALKFTSLPQFIKNQLSQVCGFSLLSQSALIQLKNSKIHVLKFNRLHCIAMLSKQ